MSPLGIQQGPQRSSVSKGPRIDSDFTSEDTEARVHEGLAPVSATKQGCTRDHLLKAAVFSTLLSPIPSQITIRQLNWEWKVYRMMIGFQANLSRPAVFPISFVVAIYTYEGTSCFDF